MGEARLGNTGEDTAKADDAAGKVREAHISSCSEALQPDPVEMEERLPLMLSQG